MNYEDYDEENSTMYTRADALEEQQERDNDVREHYTTPAMVTQTLLENKTVPIKRKKASAAGNKRKRATTIKRRPKLTPKALEQYNDKMRHEGRHLRDYNDVYFMLGNIEGLVKVIKFVKERQRYVTMDFTEEGMSMLFAELGVTMAGKVAMPEPSFLEYKCDCNVSFALDLDQLLRIIEQAKHGEHILHFAYTPLDILEEREEQASSSSSSSSSSSDGVWAPVTRKKKLSNNISLMIAGHDTMREYSFPEVESDPLLTELPVEPEDFGCQFAFDTRELADCTRNLLRFLPNHLNVTLRQRSGTDTDKRPCPYELGLSINRENPGVFMGSGAVRYGLHRDYDTWLKAFEEHQQQAKQHVSVPVSFGYLHGQLHPQFPLQHALNGRADYDVFISPRYFSEIVMAGISPRMYIMMDLPRKHRPSYLRRLEEEASGEGDADEDMPLFDADEETESESRAMKHDIMGFRFVFGEQEQASLLCFVALKNPANFTD